MAILAKIRQRSGIMIIVIALALLSFIIQDLFTKGSLGMNKKDVGSINGKDISFEDFRNKVANLEKSGQNMSPTVAANRIWEQEITVAIMTDEFEKLGLRVSDKHLIEVLKTDQNIGQNPLFQNELGAFDINKFKEYVKANPDAMAYMKEKEKDADLRAKFLIYDSLINAGLYVTQSEGKMNYEEGQSKVSFSYVVGLYSNIKESEVKVTDEEILDYMKKNEKQYKSEESREIEYVLIEDKASAEDEKDIKDRVTKLLDGTEIYNQTTGKTETQEGFRNTTNVVEFVNMNSDIPFDSSYVAKKDLPEADADKIYNLAVGENYGTYMRTYTGKGNYYCITKSLGKKSGANARASHILISWDGIQGINKREQRTKEQAKAKAQSLLAQAIANPDSFMMMAFSNSDDPSSQQGGDLGYFGQNDMVKPFNDFVFNNPVGKIGMVESQFGFHIIKIAEKQDGVRLATIALKVEPSEATSDKIFNTATTFEMTVADADFNKKAQEMKLTVEAPVSVKSMDENVGTLGAQRAIVRWAFEDGTDIGAIKRFEIANKGHVIARVKSIDKSGLMSVALAKVTVEPILRNKKKAELLKEKMKGNSLDAIAKAVNSKIEQATDVTMSSAVVGTLGREPKVVGISFTMNGNKVSEPIEGNSGVFVIQSSTIVKALPLNDYKQYAGQLKSQSSSDTNRILPVLKDLAEIEDNRRVFSF